VDYDLAAPDGHDVKAALRDAAALADAISSAALPDADG